MTKAPTLAATLHSSTTTTTPMRTLGPRATHGSGPTFGPAEPVMWSLAGERNRHGNNTRRTPNGLERLPSVAHTPDSDYLTRVVDPRTQDRYRVILGADGHSCFVVHTNSAAHVATIEPGGMFSRDGFCQYQITKTWQTGGIPEDGECLVKKIKAGTVNARKILTRELVSPKAKACKVGASCSHLEIERAARQDRNRARMAKVEEATAQKDPSLAIARSVALALAERDEQKARK